ncbi:MAG TPA: IPT/TIG domain-containing protein, partial [Planctomycetota bacterium]|nr:IPT/TIG domain-containing protein [Planctomycetota bacterium]
EARFRMPDSGLRTPPRFSTPVDVKVTSNSRSRTLFNAYSYDFPRLTGADLTGGRASGGQLMVLRGAGLAPTSTVLFRVPGVAAPFSAVVSSVSDDGTELRLLTPDLRGHESKKAAVEVTVPGVAMVPLPGTYEVRTDGSEPLLKLTSISPSTGFICGGEEVTIRGEGFLPSLSVRFGSVQALDVDVLDGTTARVTTPSMVEGTGTVAVSISNDAGPGVRRESGFTFMHPAPAFLRGDVDGDAKVTISDVVVLSDLILGKASTFPDNIDAADVNDDGVVNGGDVTVLMAFLFGGVSQLPEPFLVAGFDPTPDGLTSCASP